MTNLCQWLRRRLFRAPLADRHAVLVNTAEEVARSARVVTEQLKPFAEAPRPILALLTDLHNRRQIEDTFGVIPSLRVVRPQ